MARKRAGHLRRNTDGRLLLARLWGALCPHLDLFRPQAGPMGKERVGRKAVKKYDRPKTPYQRVLDSPP